MFIPNAYTYFIVFNVTNNPCPYIINECLLICEFLVGIDLSNNEKKSLNKKLIIHAI